MYSFDKAKSGTKAVKAQGFIQQHELPDSFETARSITGKGMGQSFVNNLRDVDILIKPNSMIEILTSYLEKKPPMVRSKVVLVEPTEEELDDIMTKGNEKDKFIRDKLSQQIESMQDGEFVGVIYAREYHSIPLMLVKYHNESYLMVLDQTDNARFIIHDKGVFFSDTLLQKSQMGCHAKSVILTTKAVELAENGSWNPLDVVKRCISQSQNEYGVVEFHLPEQLAMFSQDRNVLLALPSHIKENLPRHEAVIVDKRGAVVSRRNMILQNKSVKMAQILAEKRDREWQQSQSFER